MEVAPEGLRPFTPIAFVVFFFSRTTRSLTADGGRSNRVTWGVAVLLLGLWMAWFLGGEVTVYEVSRKARVEAREQAHAVSAPSARVVRARRVVTGQTVEAGEVLVELDDAVERARIAEAESRLRAATPRLTGLRREIATRREALERAQQGTQAALAAATERMTQQASARDFARLQAERLGDEARAGGIALVDAQRAQAESLGLDAAYKASASEQTRLRAEAANLALQQRAQIDTLERQAAELDAESATQRAVLAGLQDAAARLTVRAPVAGRVADIAPLPGGSHVNEGQLLATIVPPGQLVVVAEFDPATALGRLKSGQPGRLRLQGFPWAQYGSVDGRIGRVAGDWREGGLRAEFDLAPGAVTSAPLQHGLPGTVEAAIEQVSPALLILRATGSWLVPR